MFLSLELIRKIESIRENGLDISCIRLAKGNAKMCPIAVLTEQFMLIKSWQFRLHHSMLIYSSKN
uniref:Uncharacterized protein n=1 Tax=Strongyloides papillosus TaxID=174720 RepID=A0A0N5BVE4_STREA